jgi:hypothetical protein
MPPEIIITPSEKLISELPQIDKVRFANMPENGLVDLHFSLGMQIRNEYGLFFTINLVGC